MFITMYHDQFLIHQTPDDTMVYYDIWPYKTVNEAIKRAKEDKKHSLKISVRDEFDISLLFDFIELFSNI